MNEILIYAYSIWYKKDCKKYFLFKYLLKEIFHI